MPKKNSTQLRSGSMTAFILALSLGMTSCASSSITDGAGAGVASGGCDTNKIPGSRSSLTIQDGTLAQMASDVSNGAGKVIAAGNGGPGRKVIVFEETHVSRAGQIEIALMLLRLYNKYDLRHVSLEGAMLDEVSLPPKWFHELSAVPTSKRAGHEIAVRMLKDGEINCGEFASLVMPDLQVKGNERAEEYNVELSDKASRAATAYLISIAEKALSDSQLQKVKQLLTEKKSEEATDLLFNSDPWIRTRYEKLTSKTNITSTEESVKTLQEIEAKAKDIGANIDQENKSGLQEMINFFNTATKRSCTIMANTFAVSDQTGGQPVALIVGAAHTQRIVELLKAGDASYVVISPDSLASGSDTGLLTTAAYKRKSKLKSVDRPGLIGALLDARHKPGLVVGKEWFKSKSELGIGLYHLAAAAMGGDQPPFNSAKAKLRGLKNVTFDLASARTLKKDDDIWVICKVKARTDSGYVEFWAGGSKQPPPPGGIVGSGFEDPSKDRNQWFLWLERRLLDVLAETRGEKAGKTGEVEQPLTGHDTIKQLTTDAKITIGRTAEEVAANISG